MLFATPDFGAGAMAVAFLFVVAVVLGFLVTLCIAWGACNARNAGWKCYLDGLAASLGSGVVTALLWFVVTFALDGLHPVDVFLPGIGILTGVLMGGAFARSVSSPRDGMALSLPPSVLDEAAKRFNAPQGQDGVTASRPSEGVRRPEEEVTEPSTPPRTG
jgi:hypothetical protein